METFVCPALFLPHILLRQISAHSRTDISCWNKAAAHMQSLFICTIVSCASTQSQNAHMATGKKKKWESKNRKESEILSCFCRKERGVVNTESGLAPQQCKHRGWHCAQCTERGWAHRAAISPRSFLCPCPAQGSWGPCWDHRVPLTHLAAPRVAPWARGRQDFYQAAVKGHSS